jgi:hypothetical protein
MTCKRFGGKMMLTFAGRKFEIVGNVELDTLGRSRDTKSTASGMLYSTEETKPGLLTVEVLETISGPSFNEIFELCDENLTLVEITARVMHVCPQATMTGDVKRDRKTGQINGLMFAFRADQYRETTT